MRFAFGRFLLLFLFAITTSLSASAKCENPKIHDAIFNGSLSKVKKLVKNGEDIEARNCFGKTPLDHAVSLGERRITTFLLSKGAKINECDDATEDQSCDSTLKEAVGFNSKLSIVKMLVERGANVNARNKTWKTTILMDSLFARNRAVTEYLIRNGAEVNAKDRSDRTALSRASARGNLTMIKLLLKHNADVDVQDNYKMSPLMIAAKNGHYHSFSYILKKGANDKLVDKNGNNLMIIGIDGGNYRIFKKTLSLGFDVNARNRRGDTPLMLALREDNFNMCNKLIARGADISVSNNMGMTMMHHLAFSKNPKVWALFMKHMSPAEFDRAFNLAAKAGNLKLLKKLTKHADLTGALAKDALIKAIYRKHEDVARYLMKDLGLSIDSQCSSGNTPIIAAIHTGLKDLVDYLLEKKADINIQNKRGHNALSMAVYEDDKELVERLLALGGDPDIQITNKWSHTPLLVYAVHKKKYDILEMLLKAANTELKDNSGWTALRAAVSNRDYKAISILMKNCANPESQAKTGTTPLKIAKIMDDEHMESLLNVKYQHCK